MHYENGVTSVFYFHPRQKQNKMELAKHKNLLIGIAIGVTVIGGICIYRYKRNSKTAFSNDNGDYSLTAGLTNDTPRAPIYTITQGGKIISNGSLAPIPPQLIQDMGSITTDSGWTLNVVVGNGGASYITASNGDQTLRSNTITIPGEWIGTKPFPNA